MKKRVIALLMTASVLTSILPVNEIAYAGNSKNDDTAPVFDIIEAETEKSSGNNYGFITTNDEAAVIDDSNINVPDEYVPENVDLLIEESLEEEPVTGTTKSQYTNENLSPLRNQGTFGTCWAFSSIGLCEANLIKDDNGIDDIDLSELHLAYFGYNKPVDPLGNTNSLVQYETSELRYGGNYSKAAMTLVNWIGLASEDTLPYELATNGTTYDSSLAYKNVAHLNNYYKINIKENPNAVKDAIMEYGAVGISYTDVNAGYNSTYNTYYTADTYESSAQNHSVMIVGWDDNFSKDKFKGQYKPSSDGAWLVRNSWTSTPDTYSHRGYFWMSYEEGSIYSAVYAFDAVSSNDSQYYDNNYQYDVSINDVNFKLANDGKKSKFANVFKTSASDEEVLKAVGFKVAKNCNTDYTIDIYKNLKNETNPESGVLVYSQNGKTAYEGWYTVPLNKSILLKKNDTYSIVVTYDDTNSNGDTYCGIDKANTYTVEANKSFYYYYTGKKWCDCGQKTQRYIKLKGYTNNVTCNADKENALDYVSVSYQLNGGSLSSGTPTNLIIGENAKLPTPVKAGYEFKGWYTDSNFTNKLDDINTVNTNNITLYAKWSVINYTITYNLDGGLNNSQNIDSYTVNDIVRFYIPTKQGYNFKGWTIKFEGKQSEETIDYIEKGTTGNVTVSALWEESTNDNSEEPETPLAPTEPETPNTPNTPTEPETPNTPTEPNTPDNPSTPTEPDAPNNPSDTNSNNSGNNDTDNSNSDNNNLDNNTDNNENHTHSFQVTNEKAATCTEKGHKVYTCDCGYSYEEEYEMLKHSYKTEVVAPTCIKNGYTLHICVYCGHSYETDVVSAGHHAGEACIEDVVKATYAKKGSYNKVIYCTECHEKLSSVKKTTAKLKVSKTTIKSIKNKKNQMTISWKKASKVNGYKIQISTDKKFKKNVKSYTVKNASKTKLTLKTTPRKRYYVRISSYVISNKHTYYAAWSPVKIAICK